jgi:integrase
MDKLKEVNDRLKKGEGWIGHRFTKNDDGQKVPSKYLYFAFYQGSKQKFVNTKTNDPEQAYRQLLDARGQVDRGERMLPSEVSRMRYEDLKQILIDYYREKKPDSLYQRRSEDGGTEDTFRGADKLDEFFKRCPVPEITASKIQEYSKWRRRAGDASGTIRRQLGALRSAFYRAKALDRLTDNHIPTFELPADSAPRKGFIDLQGFATLRDAMPEHLRPAMTFLYFSGCRIGAAMKITWEMVSKDCSEIELPGEIVKNKEALTLPLVGPLEEIATTLKELRKKFPKSKDVVFNFRNFRFAWNKTCDRLGLGRFDKKLRHYEGLKPHDFRRSAARNLIKAGVDRRTAMKITGHKTEAIFERYNIKTTDDVKEALLKVGHYRSGIVTPIAEPAASR